MNTIDKDWEPVLIRLKSIVEELGVAPEVFCSRLIEIMDEACATYPDDKEKAIEFIGFALRKEF